MSMVQRPDEQTQRSQGSATVAISVNPHPYFNWGHNLQGDVAIRPISTCSRTHYQGATFYPCWPACSGSLCRFLPRFDQESPLKSLLAALEIPVRRHVVATSQG